MARTWHKEVWRIINDQKTSTSRTTDGQRVVNNQKSFVGLSDRKLQAVNAIIENYQNGNAKQVLGQYDTLADVRRKSEEMVTAVITNYRPSSLNSLVKRVQDSVMGMRDTSYAGNAFGQGGVGNMSTQSGVYGQDPTLNNRAVANIWISPTEVAAVYSQKGIYEMILKKKSQSILLNGVHIKCKGKYLSAEQYDHVEESIHRTGVAHKLAEVLNMSLGYGGSLLYPVFKKDNPLTMGMSMEALARYGVLGKNCIHRYVGLDRWNVVHVPSWDPTSEDWLNPRSYYIPFLGADVSRERCARIVTAPQNGYWGNLMTLGWGISDIPGWYASVTNYKNISRSIPKMIDQMSILVHSMNVDGLLASEGSEILDKLASEDTVKLRDLSINSMIDMDVIGDLKAIQRDFKQVPELVRLIRQDAAGDAGIPEELLWSSEKGAFASSDSNDSAFEKQSEGIRFTHIDTAHQALKIAQIEVINALGLDRDVIKALPYLYWEFDNPRVTNAMDKAEIGARINKGIFDAVAGGMPLPIAANMGQQFSDQEFHLSNEDMAELVKRQKVKDDREQEKHNKEMELMDAQTESAKAGPAVHGKPGAKAPKKSGDDKKEGHSYKDPLEQKQHEKVGAGKQQGLAKAKNKAV